jgi:HAE1 family hydrophobic/amphiphilic exporter-1
MEESASGMITVFLLAALLTYMVLAAQLESLLQPLAIVCTLPLALIGAVAALAITGHTLNVYSMIGIVLLLGLVSKNAVLLLDGINHLRHNGWETQAAIVEAGRTRVWPILMTAGSTVAGMLPLALGLGAGGETRAAMGVCVAGGLAAATVLTLVVLPVVYLSIEQLAVRVKTLPLFRWSRSRFHALRRNT